MHDSLSEGKIRINSLTETYEICPWHISVATNQATIFVALPVSSMTIQLLSAPRIPCYAKIVQKNVLGFVHSNPPCLKLVDSDE